jgi:hypothetical protein
MIQVGAKIKIGFDEFEASERLRIQCDTINSIPERQSL